ncbi:hypothetical protein IscW_ISCW002844 [Ixodes scapularis]|uniref:Uncharacterized protein n=1 Tax=Ixodes scapularis TaxID=6945 RepID=B7PC34_IXOSC|nr:hypothetical protein IscW_ISCW002844 [Ixodes scapularis]|eukprot:XP_002409264.1 hypothetical protein IscW_ISCW002844 [Ixodes scapularis]
MLVAQHICHERAGIIPQPTGPDNVPQPLKSLTRTTRTKSQPSESCDTWRHISPPSSHKRTSLANPDRTSKKTRSSPRKMTEGNKQRANRDLPIHPSVFQDNLPKSSGKW